MNPEKPKAIFLDLDDTIVTWDAVSEPVWKNVCVKFAPRVPGVESDHLYKVINEVRRWYMTDPDRFRFLRLNLEKARREIVSIAFQRLGLNLPALAVELADTYTVDRVTATSLIPGAIETLKHYQMSGSRLALLTNGDSSTQRGKIERFGLAPYFEFIIIESEFGCGKPDERVFNQALKNFSISPSEAWMVGDDLTMDISGAQNAGISTVWVDWRGVGLPSGSRVNPDRIVKTISELK